MENLLRDFYPPTPSSADHILPLACRAQASNSAFTLFTHHFGTSFGLRQQVCLPGSDHPTGTVTLKRGLGGIHFRRACSMQRVLQYRNSIWRPPFSDVPVQHVGQDQTEIWQPLFTKLAINQPEK